MKIIDNNILMIEFAATDEYKKWVDTLLAIIGYSKDNKLDDGEFINDLIANHFKSSIEFGKTIEKVKNREIKRIDEDFEEFLEETDELI